MSQRNLSLLFHGNKSYQRHLSGLSLSPTSAIIGELLFFSHGCQPIITRYRTNIWSLNRPRYSIFTYWILYLWRLLSMWLWQWSNLFGKAIPSFGIGIQVPKHGLSTSPSWLVGCFSQVLKFNLTESGLLCVLPWLTMALFANIGGWIADTLVSKGLSITTVRKARKYHLLLNSMDA